MRDKAGSRRSSARRRSSAMPRRGACAIAGDLEAEYTSYAPDTLPILRAFTDGINAYIKAIQAPGGRGLPVEFQIAGFAPEPWQPVDCLNRLAAYSMMNNAAGELLHAQLVALLGATRATALASFEPHTQLTPAPGVDFSGLSPALLANVVSSDKRIPFPASTLQESNNWTVSGALTATGKPILANDPHRIIAEPSLRYIVHLVAPGWNVIGAGEPALPGVAAGHNEHIAWGFTIFGLDQEDLYLETLDPAQPGRYKTPTGWQPMTESSETISRSRCRSCHHPREVHAPRPRVVGRRQTRTGLALGRSRARHGGLSRLPLAGPCKQLAGV